MHFILRVFYHLSSALGSTCSAFRVLEIIIRIYSQYIYSLLIFHCLVSKIPKYSAPWYLGRSNWRSNRTELWAQVVSICSRQSAHAESAIWETSIRMPCYMRYVRSIKLFIRYIILDSFSLSSMPQARHLIGAT